MISNAAVSPFTDTDIAYRHPTQPVTPPHLPFFAKFYFINALFAIGMIFGLMGLTIFLRWEYSLFGDPVGPLIFAVMFLFGDLVQKLLRLLADIKVRRLVGWPVMSHLLLLLAFPAKVLFCSYR